MKQYFEEDIKSLVLSGNILNKLKSDFPAVKLLDLNGYLYFLNYGYLSNVMICFATLGNYSLYILSLDELDKITISLGIKTVFLAINDSFGICIKDISTGKWLNINSYPDIKGILNSVKGN